MAPSIGPDTPPNQARCPSHHLWGGVPGPMARTTPATECWPDASLPLWITGGVGLRPQPPRYPQVADQHHPTHGSRGAAHHAPMRRQGKTSTKPGTVGGGAPVLSPRTGRQHAVTWGFSVSIEGVSGGALIPMVHSLPLWANSPFGAVSFFGRYCQVLFCLFCLLFCLCFIVLLCYDLLCWFTFFFLEGAMAAARQVLQELEGAQWLVISRRRWWRRPSASGWGLSFASPCGSYCLVVVPGACWVATAGSSSPVFFPPTRPGWFAARQRAAALVGGHAW